MSEGWKLDDLAARSGFSVRTLRYYLSRGLLPAPAFRGPETTYDETYLARLQAIRALSAAHEPLDAIAARLANVTPTELLRLAAGEGPSSVAAPVVVPSGGGAPSPRFPIERTVRFQLAEGLVLEARDPLDAAAERVLRSVLEHLRGPPQPPDVPPPLRGNPPFPQSPADPSAEFPATPPKKARRR